MAPPSKVALFSKTAPGWSRFDSTFFSVYSKHGREKESNIAVRIPNVMGPIKCLIAIYESI